MSQYCNKFSEDFKKEMVYNNKIFKKRKNISEAD